MGDKKLGEQAVAGAFDETQCGTLENDLSEMGNVVGCAAPVREIAASPSGEESSSGRECSR